ncbi:hypothetical protein [Rhizobium azibense]|uniref:Uncharacterized protein n=1 Tax=Rhizobium azibense TaxID=1136135 RepID=A0A4R3RHZ1_9HYPH|nr:hypothetical protein [Rhizobium azibense]TCU33122.1 hypothetical protein EV129_117119 [Rhizobium azibense]
MEDLLFSAVKERRGLWMTLSDTETLIAQGQNLITPYPAILARSVRDHYYKSQDVAELLCNFVAFENLYIDKRSLPNWGGRVADLEKALGSLSDLVKLVDVDVDVYKAAIMQAVSYIGDAGLDETYLERKLPQFAHGSEYFDGNLKAMLDRMYKDHGLPSIPPRFVDSQGSVERVLFYANVQMLSGAPVRLSRSHYAALRDFQGALPLSIIEVVEATSALEHVEANFGSHVPELLDAPIPPIFEMIIEKVKSSRSAISLAEAIVEIRDGWEGRCFRDYLWEVQNALSSKDRSRLAHLKKNLVAQLREFDAAGTSLTRWTKRVSFTVVPGKLIEFPVSLRIPRHQSQEYIGFIGRWLGPKIV